MEYNMNEKFCSICGAAYELHKANTDQCPEGGIEAPPNKRQRWAATYFRPGITHERKAKVKMSKTLSEIRDCLNKICEKAEKSENGECFRRLRVEKTIFECEDGIILTLTCKKEKPNDKKAAE